MLIIQSQHTDVYYNLALEEWLLDHAPQLPVLFLYVNDPCVVIGKNQNPWRECRLSLMEEEGVPLARRISGGGAVYHDAGNLNVSIIVPRTEYVEKKQYDLIFQTLEVTELRHRKLCKLGRSSLSIDGKKFSGQAFCHRRDRTLHHGTQLINCDLSRLGRYLGAELDGIETKAIASVPADVTNLSEAAPGLTIETFSAALIERFKTMYGNGPVERWADDEIENEAQLLPSIGKNSSKAWKLEHTPRFEVTVNGEKLTVEKGHITNVKGNSPLKDWLLRNK